MKSYNLKSMGLDALLSLRTQIDQRLTQERKGLQAQLARLGLSDGDAATPYRSSHPSKGAKVPPKYRGPGGETWAGRGAQPRWLTAAIKSGKKRDDFLI